jgi:hypothetical protein
MATSIAYVTLGNVQGHDGSNDAPPEDVVQTGVWLTATYVTVTPSNKTGISGSVTVPFNYGDETAEILEAVTALVLDAVAKKADIAPPRVRIVGQGET